MVRNDLSCKGEESRSIRPDISSYLRIICVTIWNVRIPISGENVAKSEAIEMLRLGQEQHELRRYECSKEGMQHSKRLPLMIFAQSSIHLIPSHLVFAVLRLSFSLSGQ